MLSKDIPCDGIVEMVEPAGSIFKMDMLGINTVDHWVPAHECEKVEKR